jgi:uncharacterized lipoprotein YajG
MNHPLTPKQIALQAVILIVWCVAFAAAILLLTGCATNKAPQVQHIAPITATGTGGKQSENRVVVRSEGNVTRVYIQQGGTK